MHLITLLEQKLGKIRAVLTSNTYQWRVSIASSNPMVEMGSSGDADDEPNTRACVARVNLPVIRATLRLRYSSTEMVDLAILTGAKTASDMVIKRDREKERKKERKRERERRGFKIYCRLKEDIYFYIEREFIFDGREV